MHLVRRRDWPRMVVVSMLSGCMDVGLDRDMGVAMTVIRIWLMMS